MTRPAQPLPPPSCEIPLGLHAIRRGDRRDSHANAAVWAPAVSSMDVHWRRGDGSWASETLVGLDDGVHHGVVGPVDPGALYAFWPTGEDLPGTVGEAQLLLDPYGRAIETIETMPTGTTAAGVPSRAYYSVFLEHAFDWGTSGRPRTAWRDTVIYEAHVKGLTKLHPDIPEDLRGTYAGLAHPAMVSHLRDLGVTAVELLPVHFHIDEPHLAPLGLGNYWGYNTLGFFAAHTGYASAAARAAGPAAVLDEFKGMVRALHEGGLEVILDVVLNHTAEGEQHRPALCWRGLGDLDHYRHDDAGRYVDTTGCGNTLDFSRPQVVEFALDSLRYWAEECRIDGFRLDLAVTLARDGQNVFTPDHPFLVAAARALQGTKLIAEPWDIGPDGWQTGRFPVGWADWNDGFRDTVRDFWLRDVAGLALGGTGSSPARLAGVLAGSVGTFAASGRGSLASVNLVTAHDGFTLADLTAYEHKHNEANGEGNRDGHGDNRSYNHGIEGRTDDASVLSARERSARNLLASLLLSAGVPMLTAGDELGRTQGGNNNAYCQDNASTWVHWPGGGGGDNDDDASRRMLEAARSLLAIRRDVLAELSAPARRDRPTLLWFNAAGLPMTPHEWDDPRTRTVQLLLGSPGGTVHGLVAINGSLEDTRIRLPSARILEGEGEGEGIEGEPPRWFSRAFDSAEPGGGPGDGVPGGDADSTGVRPGEADVVPADSVRVYRC